MQNTISLPMIYKISALEKIINDSIQNLSFEEFPNTLFEPIRYILSLGAKRVRPVFTLLAANLFSEEVDHAISPALAIEIFHNFSLLHDDLMDRADLRRGHATVHTKWNENTAILSGDAMLIEAFLQIAKVPSERLSQAFDLFSKTALEVCRGQQYDMDFETRTDVSEDEYIEMVRLKTAVLIACALKMGALVSGAPEIDADLLYRFGINIGIAFQLRDDLLDVYGDSKTFGKKIGGDIVCNKKTFLLIKALEKANNSQRKELEKWFNDADSDSEAKIEAVRNIYDALHLKTVSENIIEQYYLMAMDCFSSIDVPDWRKSELLTMAENLMYREK